MAATAEGQPAQRACCQRMPAPTLTLAVERQYATNSVYDLDATWQSDLGRDFHLAELRGKPVVISMFFATCQGVCIITKDDMKTVEESLPAKVRAQTAFVLVTLDPEHDSVTSLKNYRITQELSPERWHLLRGSAADTARLATMLGIGYGVDKSGLFRHSTDIIVLDPAGKIVSWQDGVHADLDKTAGSVKALL